MKKTIAQIVIENKEKALACGTTKDLYQLAIDLGFNSRAAFPRFKKALLEVCGIDYNEVRQTALEQRVMALDETVTHEVTLFSDAKARCERFAICGKNREVVWYGRFFDGEGSEQSAAELEAALKAIWLASKVRNEVCQPGKTVRLNLFVDAQWLVTLSGKAAALSDAARKFNIELSIQWIAGTSNPADRWTTAAGFKKWSETDLRSLATANDQTVEQDETLTEPTLIETASVEPIPTESTPVVIARSDRGEEFQEWFTMMGAEWTKLRDDWKAQGLSSKERDLRLQKEVIEWVKSGKPALVS